MTSRTHSLLDVRSFCFASPTFPAACAIAALSLLTILPDSPAASPRQTACAGDLNGDLTVDAADLGLLLSDFGEAAPHGSSADTNGDGVIDTADLGILLGAFDSACPPARPLFEGPQYDVGMSPSSMAVGDLNGDGHPDVVTANTSSAGISVLLGEVGGGFTPFQTLFSFAGATDLLLGDVDGDGALDLLSANGLGSTVTFHRGMGDGTFEFIPTLIPAGAGPWSIALGELTGDHIPDLAVASKSGGDVRTLFGLGGGAFGAPVSHPLGDEAASVAIVDLDGDGDLDLAAPFRVEISTGPDDFFVAALINDGDGLFAPGDVYPVSWASGYAAIVDLNLDGIPDIAGGEPILLGAGAGAFVPAPETPPGFYLAWHVFADVTGDAIPDAVGPYLGLFWGGAGLQVMPGVGDGSFKPSLTTYIGPLPQTTDAADVDGDGRLDLLICQAEPRCVLVLRARENGSFGAPVAAVFHAGDIAIADVTGDGVPDLVRYRIDRTFRVAKGVGDGTFLAPVLHFAGSSHDAIAVGDVNEDGVPDVVFLGSVALGAGGGEFLPPSNFPATFGEHLLLRDLDGDAHLDIVGAGRDQVFWQLGNGGGSFGPAQIVFTQEDVHSLAARDLDGDGLPEIAVTIRNANEVLLLFNLGGGVFASPESLPTPPAPRGIVLDDADGDLAPDIVVAGRDGVHVFSALGAGLFAEPVTHPVVQNMKGLALGDVTGDGIVDIVASDGELGMMVLVGSGNGQYRPPQGFVAAYRDSLIIADLDVDGDLDAVLHSGSPSYPLIQLNRCIE